MTDVNSRFALPIDWRKTTCPYCGGELKYGEMIFSARSLQGTLHIADDYEDFAEANEDEHLYCTGCLREWALPSDTSFDELWDEDRA
jgi:hypothetical protein